MTHVLYPLARRRLCISPAFHARGPNLIHSPKTGNMDIRRNLLYRDSRLHLIELVMQPIRSLLLPPPRTFSLPQLAFPFPPLTLS